MLRSISALILLCSIELKPISFWTSINATKKRPISNTNFETLRSRAIVLKNNLLTTLQFQHKNASGSIDGHEKVPNILVKKNVEAKRIVERKCVNYRGRKIFSRLKHTEKCIHSHTENNDETRRVYAFGAINARLNSDFDKLLRLFYGKSLKSATVIWYDATFQDENENLTTKKECEHWALT